MYINKYPHLLDITIYIYKYSYIFYIADYNTYKYMIYIYKINILYIEHMPFSKGLM